MRKSRGMPVKAYERLLAVAKRSSQSIQCAGARAQVSLHPRLQVTRTQANSADQEGETHTMIRNGSFSLVATLVLVAASGGATAQQPTQAQADAIRQYCRADYQSLCASVPPGGSAALQCLRGNLSSLSPGCQNAVGAVGGSSAAVPPATPPTGTPAAPPGPPLTPREQAMMMRQACGADFRVLCRGVPLGGGQALACLADNRESLSEPCKGALARMRER